jgi:hypothetical protein
MIERHEQSERSDASIERRLGVENRMLGVVILFLFAGTGGGAIFVISR